MEWEEECNSNNNISNSESIANEVWFALEVGVKKSDLLLDVLDWGVEDFSLDNTETEDGSYDVVKVGNEGCVWEINELIDLSTLEVVGTGKSVGAVFSEESSDGSWLNEDTLFGLEDWELSSEWLGLELLWLGDFFWDNFFSDLNTWELGGDVGNIDEKVSGLSVAVELLYNELS